MKFGKRFSLRRPISYFCLILFISLLSCSGKHPNPSATEHAPESIVEKIKLKDLNGQPIDLAQYRGKTVFINFWATWCGPCIKEMPSIERVKNILKNGNIEFLAASNEDVDQIQSFIAKRNVNLHFVQLQNLEELGIPALPVTYIISSKGELAFSETGYREWDTPSNIELLTKITEDHD